MPIPHASALRPSDDDLVAIPGPDHWRLWRWAGLRSAGFPVRLVLTLARSAAAAAADLANRTQVALDDGIEQVHRLLVERFDQLCRTSPGHRLTRRGSGPVRAMRALRAGRVPEPFDGEDQLDLPMAWLRGLAGEAAAAGTAYRTGFAAAAEATSAAIAELAADPAFCEASIWQNRQAYVTGIRPLRRTEATSGPGLAPGGPGTRTPRNTDHRQHEQLVARRVQRYATKNDTIGFFGPVGWARMATDGPRIAVRHGPGLVRHRSVHFEQWTVDSLAEALAAREGMAAWLAPRRLPFHTLDGTTTLNDTTTLDGITLRQMNGPPIALSAAEAAVLVGCTGTRTAGELTADLLGAGVPGLADPGDVDAVLHDLRARNLITWALEVPFITDADRALHAMLNRIGDADLRTAGLAALHELRAAKQAVARAAGQPDQLDQCLANLEATFERLTGRGATRSPGRNYAARTLIYEDCQRDLDLTLGPQLLAELGLPLGLVLRSARWVNTEAESRFQQAFARLYRELAEDLGPSVPVVAMWLRLPEVFSIISRENTPGQLGQDLQAELTRRWSHALGITDLSQSRVHRSYADVAGPIAQAFPESSPGWRLGHYHSPDIMIAAADPAAIDRGDYLLVLGEVHLAGNTLGAALFVDEHPAPQELARAAMTDLGMQRVVSVGPRQWVNNTSRTRQVLPVPRATYLLLSHEFVPAEPAGPPPQVSLAELLIEPDADRLVARTRDGRFQCETVELVGDLISQSVVNMHRLFADAPHVPRITIDRFVLQRETWRFAAGEIPVEAADEADRYRSVRGWSGAAGLPRMVFYTAPVEEKPLFLDLDSPILTEIFIKTVRRSVHQAGPLARISLSEMLPTIEQSWLADASGARYTSEVRVVVVDLAGTPAA